MDIYNIEKFMKNFVEPNSSEQLEKWLKLDCIVDILNDEIQDDYILLYASSQHLFIHSAFIENLDYSDSDINSLLDWSGNPYSSWSISYSIFNDKVNLPEIEEPMWQYNSLLLKNGEQIVFGRGLDGVEGYENYYEINQKIVHSLGLHYLHEKESWCKLDKNGDIDECIKYVSLKENSSYNFNLIFIKKSLVSLYGRITNQNLCRMIDITAYRKSFYAWSDEREYQKINMNNIYGDLGIDYPIGSYFRGIQLFNTDRTIQSIINELEGIDEDNGKYVDLWINDIKHNHQIILHSSSPECFDNYFNDTGKPWGTSPAFFNAEVLVKYKNNTEKYTMRDRSIDCRGAWSLRAYDINKADQVSVYLCDFHHLPYKEQLHWKKYNEKPKDFISEAAFETDFLGRFTDKSTSLQRLKYLLSNFVQNNVQWWQLKDRKMLDQLSYPHTDSKDEWAEELLRLDQVIIEGFNQSVIKNIAEQVSAKVERNYRSLKLLESILIAKDFDTEYARQIMSVFHEIHNLRSSQKGHVSGNSAEDERKSIIKKHKSYKAHFDYLYSNLIESFDVLIDTLR